MVTALAPAEPLNTIELVGVRAALAAGAAPGAALEEARSGPLAPVARAVRMGRSVAEEAARVDTGDLAADLLVRALGVAELAGVGAGEAVQQSMRAIRDGAALDQLLRVRTAQARATARMLAAIPVVAWLLLAALDPRVLGFYATPAGATTGGAALCLAVAGRWWSARQVDRARVAGAEADPLMPSKPRRSVGRGVVAGLPAFVAGALVGGPLLGALAAVAVGWLAARPRVSRAGQEAPDTSKGGAAEAAELVAVALAAGLPTVAAADTVARLAPPAARPALAGAARRLRGGWDPETAFEDTGLAALGRVLGTADRWGAPSAEALQELADDLRAARRAAAEEAAERVQVALVFPTTLLTLPAFVMAVVPPLLWTAFSGGVGLT